MCTAWNSSTSAKGKDIQITLTDKRKSSQIHGARIQDCVFIGISRARVMEKAERNFQLSSALSRFNP